MATEYGVMDEHGTLIGMPTKHFAERSHAEGLMKGLQQASKRGAAAADAAELKLTNTLVMSVAERENLRDDIRLGRMAMARTFRLVQREVGEWQTA